MDAKVSPQAVEEKFMSLSKDPTISGECSHRLAKDTQIMGHNCTVFQIFYHVSLICCLGLVVLVLFDIFLARHTKARWFLLHFVANIIIAALCVPDLIFMFSNPLIALAESRFNYWPTSMVFSIHLYHITFFRNLEWVDWMHHTLMVLIGAPLLLMCEMGPIVNVNNFFMCGLPGGIDYAMLFAVKHGYMSTMTEKKYNAAINAWIRSPSLVWVSCLVYVRFFVPLKVQKSVPVYLTAIRVFLMLLGSWNGLYFMQRVIGNYHICRFKASMQAVYERTTEQRTN